MAKSLPSPAASGRVSRSAIGRASGRFAHLVSSHVSLHAAGRFLRRQLWAWPILAALLLGTAGWWVSSAVEGAMRESRAHELATVLDADVTALRQWMQGQQENAQLLVMDEQLVPPVRELLGLQGERALLDARAQAALRARLGPRLPALGYHGFFVVAPAGVIVAAEQDMPVGKALTGYRQEFYQGVLAGKASVSKPFRSPMLQADERGELRAELPTMFAAAPLRDGEGKVIAALGLRIRPEDQFTRILQIARSGDTGETYAFDKSGLFLSNSRFDEDLKQIGLLVDQPGVRSILTLELRDPQGDMTAGARPKLRRAEQPLTRMAAAAVAGESGSDVDGYRDYRGVPVVGAWTWLPEYDFGVATEVDVAESFRPLYILRRAFWGLITLLVLAALAIFVLMLYLSRQHHRLQEAVLAARQLGQYTLQQKLGAGGMGTVYLARHALLRRPTAIKLLDVDKMSDAAVSRFEREVQMTAGLTHPNTVAIYDYGRTPEGIFYYAMEYLEGLTLDDLVKRYGPLPEARVVYLVRQVCAALAEAHGQGLVHRDIKPANIFLTCRGGQYDFAKVLDFGLVKALAGAEQTHLTSASAVTGTPLYMSPEGVQDPEHVDARADVYALGAVAYFLLTGTPVFTGEGVMDICMKHVNAVPEPPASRLGRPVSPDLERLILRCLAKAREERPASAAVLVQELDACAVAGHWSAADAQAWWSSHVHAAAGAETAALPAPAATTDVFATRAYDTGRDTRPSG